MKKIFIALLIIVFAAVIYFKFFASKPNTVPTDQAQTSEGGNSDIVSAGFGDGGSGVDSDVVETSEGVVYTGKVVPVESRYYEKTLKDFPEGLEFKPEFRDVYVNKGDIIEKGALLFDYHPDYAVDAKIDVANKKFVKLKQDLDDYYSRIEEFKTWLAGADKSDKGYIAYLNDEIKKTEGLISENKVEWVKTEELIRKLNESRKGYQVKSDISGLVYAVNKDSTEAPTNNAKSFVTVYSLEKKVRINVSEYEYRKLSISQKVSVKIEGLDNKEYEGTITHIDPLPNNLETNDTSTYYVDIKVDDSIPYGYTAVVTVKK